MEKNGLEAKTKLIRRYILEMLTEAGSGHTGGSLSAAEILVALYFHKMKHNPNNPSWSDRDRFVLSKGHAAPLLYAVLAELGYFPIEELKTLRKIGSRLQGHPDIKTPGIEINTGSLGQGLSIGVGMSLAGKLDEKDYRIYVLLGDGEVQEGQVWEAAMSASHYKLDNLTAILDRNKLQIDGSTVKVMSIEPLSDKWKSFGWYVEQVDGHNIEQIVKALDRIEEIKNKPSIIIAHTTKRRGVSFMEGVAGFHGKAPNKKQLQEALKDLG